LDGHGKMTTKKYRKKFGIQFEIPKDIYYCPGCKQTKKTTAIIAKEVDDAIVLASDIKKTLSKNVIVDTK
jgi:hypothetical protein